MQSQPDRATARQMYNSAGGLSGGQAAAAVREAADRMEMLALAQKGIRAKYFKDLPSFLSLAEITETGTRLQLFKRSFERAKKEGFNDYDSLIEAAFAARDYIDFGRNGSRMIAARKIITFLNATMQGLDKTLRASVGDPLAAAGRYGVKEVLRPLFQMEPGVPMRREDVKALKLASKVWTKVSIMAVFGLALTAIYSDDEEYQEISEYTRTNNWLVRIGGGQWAKIPKPFELGLPSTVLERAYEAMHFGDPGALEKLVKGVFQTLAMPDSNPLLKTAVELKTNKNMTTGGNIVPQSKEDELPQDQFNGWTSTFSRRLGDALGVSPAKIDHAITGFGGSWGAWFQKASNLTDPDRPAGQLADAPLARRFVTEWQRGAQDKTTFFERVGGRTSALNQRLNSIKARVEQGRPGEAALLLNDADEPGRLWLMTQLAGGDETGAAAIKRLHPLERAKVVNLEVSRMIDEIHGGMPKDDGEALPKLSPQEKAVVQDALERLAVAEIRNALIATRQPGYENRQPMVREAYMEELKAAAPGLYDELERRVRDGRDKAYSYDAVMKLWPEVEGRLKQDGPTADLGDLAAEAKGRSAE